MLCDSIYTKSPEEANSRTESRRDIWGLVGEWGDFSWGDEEVL
jgi:hypothetical protein